MRVPCLYTTQFTVDINDDGEVELLIRRKGGFAVVLVLQDSPLMFRNLYRAFEEAEIKSGVRKRMAKHARKRMRQVVIKPRRKDKPSKPGKISGGYGGPSKDEAKKTMKAMNKRRSK